MCIRDRRDDIASIGARGVTVADLNRDGWLDIATANHAPGLLKGGPSGFAAEGHTIAVGGSQHLRLQTREDGVSVDQVVLSAEKYFTSRPGAVKNDVLILPPSLY